MARSPRDIERIHSTQEVMANFAVSQTLWIRTSRSGSRSRAYELEAVSAFDPRAPGAIIDPGGLVHARSDAWGAG